MSDDVIRAVQATLSELITYALSEQLGNAYGTYITSSIITQFATPYADTVSTNVIQQATPLIRSIGKTCFILGVAHFVNAIALIGSIKLWYMERGRSVRCWLLMLACLSNFISIPVILAAIKGGSEQLRQATPYVAAFFVEGSTGMLILSVLWQAVILWSNPYQMIYRTVSILLVFVYSAIQFYAGVTSFENCVIGQECPLQQRWVTLGLVIFYIGMYMIPYLGSLRRYTRTMKASGTLGDRRIEELEVRSLLFAIPSASMCLIFAIWQSYISDELTYHISADIWIALFCLNEVLKDAFPKYRAIRSFMFQSRKPVSIVLLSTRMGIKPPVGTTFHSVTARTASTPRIYDPDPRPPTKRLVSKSLLQSSITVK